MSLNFGTQFNHSKLCNFTSPWELVKATWNCVKGSFFIKLTKICTENQEWNVLYILSYDITCARLKTLQLHNFMRTDQNTTELCTRLFFHKIIKIMPRKQGWFFGLRSSLKYVPMSKNKANPNTSTIHIWLPMQPYFPVAFF